MNWGIIGLGKIANKFAAALKIVDEAVIYAVASRSVAKANEFAERHQAIIAYDSYEKLFQDKNIDVVYIGTPHVFHNPTSVSIIRNYEVEETMIFDEDGNGMQYQAIEVQNCIKAGKIQSDLMSWNDSLLLHKVIDWVRKEAGIVYEWD